MSMMKRLACGCLLSALAPLGMLAIAPPVAAAEPPASEAPGASAEPATSEPPLQLNTGDKLVILGNTLAERMQHDGYFETRLQARFPQQRLVVRNLGWSADEIDLRPRSANFADHGHNLSDHDPAVVLAMFGFNESFAGPAGLDGFRQRFQKFIDQTKQQLSESAQLVICSPIPHEALGRPALPDPEPNNANLQLYSDVMREVAGEQAVRFVDLFTPLQAAMDSAQQPLTINGIHLNQRGNEVLAAVLDVSLFGPADDHSPVDLEALRAAVCEKNHQFFHDYRAVNGYYIYGGRKSPYGVVNFPEEFAKLRNMIAVRDQRIWDIARGKPVPEQIDDSQTGELTPIETNYTAEVQYLTPEQSKEMFDLAEGFEIELVVSEADFPEMVNPVALDIDARGRLWVTTNPSYPQYLPGTPADDKILIYEDLDGDGKADKQTVFADGLHLPIGIALADGGAYVSQQPDLMFLKDTDGDDVADVRERVLHGFDSADSHHSLSAFVFGPDGALYFQEGTFHFTQVETPYGPQRVRDAAVFRYEPLTEKFNIFVSYNFANPWGHCFDHWGQNFIADASPGANYFAAPFSGDVIYPHKHRKMDQFFARQWRPTAGCVIVSSSHFPESMQGNYLLNNTIGFLGTLNYQMSESGSGFEAAPVQPLLSSRDTNFRPIDLKFGPDGALYIVDWFNPLIGHMQHNLRDPKRDKHHGRVWRVRHKDKPLLEIPPIEGAPIADVVRLLERYDQAVRHLARMELRQRETAEVVAAVDQWFSEQVGDAEQTEHNRLEALWVMQQHDQVRPDLLQTVLQSRDGRARAAATRVLSYWRQRVEGSTAMLVDLALDPEPRVRLEAVRAASFYADANEGRAIVAAALTQPLDDYLNYVIAETNTTLDRRGGSQQGGDDVLIQRVIAGDVTESQLVAIVRAAVQRADGVQIGQLVDAVLAAEAAPQTRAAALDELLRTAQSKRLQPVIDVDLAATQLAQARQQGDTALMVSIAEIAAAWNVEELMAELRVTARDAAVAGEAVDAALAAIVSFSSPFSHDTRGQFLRDDLPSDLRLRFARAVAPSSAAQGSAAIGLAIEAGIAPRQGELLVRAAQAVLSHSGGLPPLTAALQKNRPAVDEAKLILRALFAEQIHDGPLVELLSQIAGIGGPSQPLTPQERQTLVRRIDSSGDPHRGQQVYRRKELNCIGCHIISGAGGNVGPDLSGVGVTSPTEYLLDSILDPSAAIKEAYLTRQVLSGDGIVYRGVQVDRDDQRLILRDENGEEIVIAQGDIEAETEGKSLMPEGLHHLITEDELVDLVAFLSALGKPGDFAVNNRATVNRYAVLADSQAAAKLAELPLDKLADAVAQLPADAWHSAYTLVDGTLPADALPAAAPSVLVLRGQFEVVVPGKIALTATSQSEVQVVIGGQTFRGAEPQEIDLPAGEHEFYLVFPAPQAFHSLRSELTRPPRSAVQFTVIGGI